MTGAYTAKPEDVAEDPEIPEGWDSNWPFPGPLPPGYSPVYAINFKLPPTPDEVAVGEEITVRVKVYQLGAGDSQLGTIQPNENIAWTAFLDDEEIDSSSEGWTYISGRYYSSWTFTPPLLPEDVTEPPKVMTITAEGVMNNGSFSSSLSAEEGIDIVAPSLDINVRTSGGMTSDGLMSVAIYIYVFDSDSNVIFYATWGGTYYEASGELVGSHVVYQGTLPDDLTYEITSDGTYVNLDLTWPIIEDDKRYLVDAKATGYNGNPTGIFSGTLSTGSSKTDTVVSTINWLEGQLQVLPESDEVTWNASWKDGVGGWPSPW